MKASHSPGIQITLLSLKNSKRT